MRELFKGWRRKAGCVFLLVAGVITSAWVRSRSIADVLIVPIGSRQQMFCSIDGHVYWWGATRKNVSWYANSIDAPISKTTVQLDAERAIIQGTNGARFVEWVIPYWALSIPLTLFSACLLLSKPRGTKILNPPLPMERDDS